MQAPEPDAVVFLHGVGLDPQLFGPVMERLPLPACAPLRAPYRPAADRPQSVMTQASELLRTLAASDYRQVIVAGVSGGATIAVAAAIALRGDLPTDSAASNIRGFVVHEPLLGPLAGELHAIVEVGADRLTLASDVPAVERFLADLVGHDVWAAVPESARDFAAGHAQVVIDEVAQFIEFRPSLADLRSIDIPLIVTTGGRSGSHRHTVAELLQRESGASSRVIPAAGHLAHFEQPAAFARIVMEMAA